MTIPLDALIFGAAMLTAALSSCSDTDESGAIIIAGDSITRQGAEPTGYVTLIRDSLLRRPDHAPVNVVGSGVDGDKVPDLDRRLQSDVLDRHPSVVVVFIGVNDAWHYLLGLGGTPREQYRQGLENIADRIKASGARTILCTPAVIGERSDGGNPLDVLLEEYCSISRTVAAEKRIELCDLRKSFLAYLREHNPSNKENGLLTTDGVHLTPLGNSLVASEILKLLTKDRPA